MLTLILAAGLLLGNDEAAVRQTMDDYAKALNARDAKAAVSLWTDDAIYANRATGVYLKGHDDLLAQFKRWIEKSGFDKVDLTVREVTFPEPGKALEKGSYRVTFKGDQVPMQNAFAALLVKEGDKWLLQDVRQVENEIAPSNYEHLKELEWLIGDWEDSDEEVDIYFHNSWDTHKNFLTQEFDQLLYGEPVMDGIQIIGWDPVQQKIHSWIFDSDGGFGEGRWSRQDNKWTVRVGFTLASGKKSSALQIYTKLDDNSYTWESVNRDVDGTVLPNIPPIKLVREQEDNQ